MTTSYNATSQQELRKILHKLLGDGLSKFNLDKMIISNVDIRNNYFDTSLFSADYIMKMKPYSTTLLSYSFIISVS